MLNPIPGSGLSIGIHTIFCIGRNYAEHVAELQNTVPDEPVVFTKPLSSVIYSGSEIVLPPHTSDVHHEVEIVVAIGKKLSRARADQAKDAIAAIGVGLDMTARDIQQRLKEKGLPWDLAKGLDTFTVIGTFFPFTSAIDLTDIPLQLSVNGEVKQKSNSSLMLFPIVEIIAFLSFHFTLQPGDLIFTGTPKGVGRVKPGDFLVGGIPGTEAVVTAGVRQA
jgi:2-keto-4-pentenoate hydratase/2-oxohepta-3-ene-1,7-dioic acid hydratase in catechol pathway